MFTPPAHGALVICEPDRRVTALADLAASGPESLMMQLSERARGDHGHWDLLRSPARAA
jgi:hypothetical protein